MVGEGPEIRFWLDLSLWVREDFSKDRWPNLSFSTTLDKAACGPCINLERESFLIVGF